MSLKSWSAVLLSALVLSITLPMVVSADDQEAKQANQGLLVASPSR